MEKMGIGKEEEITLEYMKNSIRIISNYVSNIIEDLDEERVREVIKRILKANRIFVMGAGRSGLVMRAFAMRLMHLGFTTYVVGEIVTPAVREGDLVIVASGSGETLSVVNLAKIAKDIGAQLVLFTSNPESTMAKIADVVVAIKGRISHEVMDYMERQLRGDYKSLTPLGTVFEILTLIVLDGMVAELIHLTHQTEEHMKSRHAVLE
jgi:6-phospho-3-hexuloisomerase